MSEMYAIVRDAYARQGVDAEAAIARLDRTALTLPCWQGDDVTGLERGASGVSGGIAATGNYPYRATNGDQLRGDLTEALRLVPGTHKIGLHASYAENTGNLDRNAYTIANFSRWVDWAKDLGIGLDYNPTFFSHPKASGDLTLSSPDKAIRDFWIEHAVASRGIAADLGCRLGRLCVNNLWIPDGSKDDTPNRMAARERLLAALDAIYAQDMAESLLDAVESKLFGIGSEAFVVGSHEFYLGYAARAHAAGKRLAPTLDLGHFHPTEQIADKISSLLLFHPVLLLHISRGVRWDSDHVAVVGDELRKVMLEIVRAGALDRVHLGLDFFDASINRVAALIIGARSVQRALLAALLEPVAALRTAEAEGRWADRLALIDAGATAPVGVVYDEYCRRKDCPPGTEWLAAVAAYERNVMAGR